MSESTPLEYYAVPDLVTSVAVPPVAPGSVTCQSGREVTPAEAMEQSEVPSGGLERGSPYRGRGQDLHRQLNDNDLNSVARERGSAQSPGGRSSSSDDEAEPAGPGSESERCPVHEEDLSWFCYTEDHRVCSHCAIEGMCKTHRVKPLDRRATDVRNKLVDLCEKLQLRSAAIEKHLAEVLPSKNQSVASAASSARELVIQRLNYIREACDNEEQSLLEQVHTEEERAHQNILTQRVHWTESLEKLSAIKGYLVDVVTKTDDRTLVRTEKEIFERAEETEGILEPEESEQLKFNQKCVQSPLLHTLWASAVLINVTDIEDVQINEKTISPCLMLSEDKKILSFVSKKQKDYQYYPERFDHWPNALAVNCFQNGIHTWWVDVGKSCAFKLGISYACLERKGSGSDSRLGYNTFSWVFSRYNEDYFFTHDGKQQKLDLLKRPVNIGILIDFQGGEVLFYDSESHTIICAHHSKFTAPVYPAFAVANDCIKLVQ
ncbi:B box and SPRY domain-containing protein [Protopterus annectens]|uniref:B box and SPRY domain-containing protein n=1 Tax=Protopterus annectens TaxID=7888 RepID=UPI001CFBE2A3|nr:B box and SPRY domain-containing protein [Protopterus annectens]